MLAGQARYTQSHPCPFMVCTEEMLVLVAPRAAQPAHLTAGSLVVLGKMITSMDSIAMAYPGTLFNWDQCWMGDRASPKTHAMALAYVSLAWLPQHILWPTLGAAPRSMFWSYTLCSYDNWAFVKQHEPNDGKEEGRSNQGRTTAPTTSSCDLLAEQSDQRRHLGKSAFLLSQHAKATGGARWVKLPGG